MIAYSNVRSGRLAQLVEHSLDVRRVSGSSPLTSTNFLRQEICMKVSVVTFGCKVNQYDSESVLNLLTESGYTRAKSSKEADIVIFNSCAVTAESSRKLKKSLNSVKKVNRRAVIVMMGCLSQAFPGIEKDFEDVDIFLGNSNKNKVVSLISDYFKSKTRVISVAPSQACFPEVSISKFSDRTRAFIKIQDGCDRFCSYCIIPYARGRVRSRSVGGIVSEVERLAANGYKEVTLVGINLSSYGLDSGEKLDDLVGELALISGLERIRLGSLEPDLVTDEFLSNLSKNLKFCPQFHLSLQSGSNKVLKDMRRLYTREEYISLVERIRKLFRNSTITTDLIVGFPGETDQDFESSIKMLKMINFLKVHVFPYSAREGTLAAKMKNQISKDVKSERVKLAIQEANRQTDKILSSFVGSVFQVLYENAKENGIYEGYTQNYVLVKTKSIKNISGKIVSTRIKSYINGCCIGEIV